LSRVAGENVGTYVIGQGDLALSSNYILDFTAGELEITTASLTITAVDESRQYSDPNPAWTVTYDGFVFGEDESVLGGTLTFTGDGPDSDNTTGPGLYDITPGGLTSSNYSITFVNGVLTITPEDANITYVGDRLVATTTGSATLNLRAVIEDIPDVNRGLIENATVSFEVFEDGDLIQTISGDLTQLDGNPRIAVASASFNVNEVSDARTFEIQVVVGGYYYSELETPVVAVVYIPVGDHVTGGGFIIPDDDSAGAYPSDAGSHANFGFNMKYQKKGKIITLQGEMNLVIRHEGQTYQFKSTAPVSLGINNAGEDPTAQLTYLGNLNQGNNNPLLSGVILNVTLTDRGNPGIHNDDIGFTIWNGNDLVYSNQWTGYQTERQLLDGGNLVIHKGGTSDEDVILINPEITVPDEGGIAIEVEVDHSLKVFPNPFRNRLNFRFAPVVDAQIRLELFDMTGALVEVVFEGLVEANQPVEVHYVPQLRSTAFLFYRLTIGNEVSTGKVMYQK
ncbi:MAG: MBG domain-containing protein, partial [Bacteroidales bacterium]|nr:MBG domain-containing protein [Bacteroidales bacterium]